MHSRSRFIRTVLVAVAASDILLAQSGTQRAKATLPADQGWPRQYTNGTAQLVISQPQVDTWTGFEKLTARLAAALKRGKGTPEIWGVLSVESDTAVDMESRTVALMNFRLTNVNYPAAKGDAEAKELEALTIKLLPKYPTTVALDRILAYMGDKPVSARPSAVKLEPPPILVSQQPAALVIIDGDPVTMDIENTTLQKIVNTNWDIFHDKKTSRYYLRDGKSWLSAKGLGETWSPVTKLPDEFAKLPPTELYKEIKEAAANPQKPTPVKLVMVVYKPSELIVIAGEPLFQPVTGTRLMWVTNTECDLFFDSDSRQFYFLTSGRWFRASELKSGSWTAATTSLPEDFRKIPPDHPRSHVLASVPGTQEAEDAVMNASIPQAATITRASIKADVKWVGDPKFEPIAGTAVSYGSNTPNDVFRFEDRYYLCLQGVWFVSASANGPWAAADKIPQEIYEIPSSSSKYHVTYVTIPNSTPETVTYAYTAGYTGIYVGYGVAMWGTGYYYPPYYGMGYYPYPVYWPCPYYTYGASAWYNPATGSYGRGSAVYGPYGGYARGAAYNPATGSYAWGRTAWGPYGAAASGGFYNPTTGRWGGSYHASNGYQSWGQSVVRRGDNWARTGSYSDARGTVAGIETSAGGKAIAARGGQGQGFAGKSAAGDFYAGRDGNVYKREQSGQWYRNDGGSWQPANRPAPANQGVRASELQSARSGAGSEGSLGTGANGQGVQGGLDRDASARNRGNYNTQRSESARKSSGWNSGGWTGARSSGWTVRSPGFGRR